ncbi:MAG: hypothetical protein V4450_17050 [Bacteroidota bacterium]
MRLKNIPLLVLTAISICFMAFLVIHSGPEKIACEKKCPMQKQVNNPESGGEIITGSFEHLIVSTRK